MTSLIFSVSCIEFADIIAFKITSKVLWICILPTLKNVNRHKLLLWNIYWSNGYTRDIYLSRHRHANFRVKEQTCLHK